MYAFSLERGHGHSLSGLFALFQKSSNIFEAFVRPVIVRVPSLDSLMPSKITPPVVLANAEMLSQMLFGKPPFAALASSWLDSLSVVMLLKSIIFAPLCLLAVLLVIYFNLLVNSSELLVNYSVILSIY